MIKQNNQFFALYILSNASFYRDKYIIERNCSFSKISVRRAKDSCNNLPFSSNYNFLSIIIPWYATLLNYYNFILRLMNFIVYCSLIDTIRYFVNKFTGRKSCRVANTCNYIFFKFYCHFVSSFKQDALSNKYLCQNREKENCVSLCFQKIFDHCEWISSSRDDSSENVWQSTNFE